MEAAQQEWEDGDKGADEKLQIFEQAYQAALERVIRFSHILPRGRRKFNPTILRRKKQPWYDRECRL